MKAFICLSLCFWATFAYAQDKLGVVNHNHVALHVKDIEVSRHFYQFVIGLEPIAVPDNLKKIRAWFKIGEDGQQIHLLAGRDQAVHHDRNGSHIALFVESIGNAETFLIANKVPYHKQVRFDKVIQIYFEDPDKYLIELNEEPKKK
jgi:lactoylglutathione lyase